MNFSPSLCTCIDLSIGYTGRQSMWDKIALLTLNPFSIFFFSFFWLYEIDKLVRLSVSKTLQSLDIPPSFLELKEELIYSFAWDTHSHLDSSKKNKKWEKYWVQKKGDQCFVMGVFQTLCNLYTFVFFMVSFLYCSFAFRVEKGHVGYVELLLAHPLLLKLLKMDKNEEFMRSWNVRIIFLEKHTLWFFFVSPLP